MHMVEKQDNFIIKKLHHILYQATDIFFLWYSEWHSFQIRLVLLSSALYCHITLTYIRDAVILP